MDDRRRKHRLMLEQAFSDYLNKLDSSEFERQQPFLSFDFDFLKNRKWRISLAEWMVVADLRELTNKLNTWQSMLISWAAWNSVIGDNEDVASLSLRREFCDSLVHDCMLLPSAIRDVFVAIATDSLHQLRMAQDPNVPDSLIGDAKPPTYKPKVLFRSEKEAQLREMLCRWASGAQFWSALDSINSDEYERDTFNYRNSHAHHIGPRLGFGEVRPVIRRVEQATRLERQSDGTYLEAVIPGISAVGYAFGGLRPLDYEAARRLNADQYNAARRAYDAYVQLLKTEVRHLPFS